MDISSSGSLSSSPAEDFSTGDASPIRRDSHTKLKKNLYPCTKFLDHDFGDGTGIEWSYNSCFIDSVVFSMFAFQDCFDDLLLKDFDEPDAQKNRSIVKSQTMLRKIVNHLRGKGFVKSEVVYRWRCHLYKEQNIKVSFKHKVFNACPIYIHKLGSHERPKKLVLSNIMTELKSNLPRSSEVILEPNHKIDFTTAIVSDDIPARISFKLVPRKKDYTVTLIPEFEAEFADATEFLQAILELFDMKHTIETISEVETSSGNISVADKHRILFLGIPEDAQSYTLQELLQDEYVNSRMYYKDTDGVVRTRTTTITSVHGNGLLIALKRMSVKEKDKARNIPVFIDFELDVSGVSFQLMSIVCQSANHYHTFARHPKRKDQWFYYNDKYKKTKHEGIWTSSVIPLSRGFVFPGFSELSEFEKKLKSMITTSAYMLTYKRK